MIHLKQWEAFTKARRLEKLAGGAYTFFPKNSHGIPTGYYRDEDIVELLRKHKALPRTVQFILDMIE